MGTVDATHRKGARVLAVLNREIFPFSGAAGGGVFVGRIAKAAVVVERRPMDFSILGLFITKQTRSTYGCPYRVC